jgi:hypothetical protein
VFPNEHEIAARLPPKIMQSSSGTTKLHAECHDDPPLDAAFMARMTPSRRGRPKPDSSESDAVAHPDATLAEPLPNHRHA